jgi:hypothetical protein
MRTERICAAIGSALVTLGIAAPFLPARGMTLNQCKRAHAGYCAYRLVGGGRDWEPGLRRHGSGHAGEVVPVPVRRIHAVLHDADPTRWGSPPPPPDHNPDTTSCVVAVAEPLGELPCLSDLSPRRRLLQFSGSRGAW